MRLPASAMAAAAAFLLFGAALAQNANTGSSGNINDNTGASSNQSQMNNKSDNQRSRGASKVPSNAYGYSGKHHAKHHGNNTVSATY
jgi:hypothetical protein